MVPQVMLRQGRLVWAFSCLEDACTFSWPNSGCCPSCVGTVTLCRFLRPGGGGSSSPCCHRDNFDASSLPPPQAVWTSSVHLTWGLSLPASPLHGKGPAGLAKCQLRPLWATPGLQAGTMLARGPCVLSQLSGSL